MAYILNRIGFYVIAAWASLTFNFFLPRLMPGDPGDALAAQLQGRVTAETLAAMEQAYGISDDPLWKQYFAYLGNIFRGEMGVSTSNFPAPVSEVIGMALWWTVLLGGTAVIIAFLIGTALGVIAAWR